MTLGAASQIIATAALLRAMQARSFALGVAYSKTEILLVALFGLVFLGDALSLTTTLAVLLGTLGVLLLAPADPERPLRALLAGWSTPAALWGLASGVAFALAAVGFRGATLQTSGAAPVLAAASTLVVAQLLQTRCSAAICSRASPGGARGADAVAAVAVRWFHGCGGVGRLVHRVCARERGARAHARAGGAGVQLRDLAAACFASASRGASSPAWGCWWLGWCW